MNNVAMVAASVRTRSGDSPPTVTVPFVENGRHHDRLISAPGEATCSMLLAGYFSRPALARGLKQTNEEVGMSVKRYSFSPVAVITQKGASGYSLQCELGVTEYPLGNAGDYVLATDFDAVVKERDLLKARLEESELAASDMQYGSTKRWREYQDKYPEVS